MLVQALKLLAVLGWCLLVIPAGRPMGELLKDVCCCSQS